MVVRSSRLDDATTLESYETYDIASVSLRLRDELQITTQSYGQQLCYLIEDPFSNRFHRIGLPEYTILSLLDGDMTVGEAVGVAAEIVGQSALDEYQAFAFCKWLVDEGLALTSQSASAGRLAECQTKLRQANAKQWNPLFQRLPLFDPDRLLGLLTPIFSPLFGRYGVVAGILLIVVAISQLWIQWSMFTLDSVAVIDSKNWLWFVATAALLRVVHELGHGVACKRLGGFVPEAGAIFILFVPLPYVDATSSWRFSSKWERIGVALAGVYVELIVAAIAIILWTQTTSPIVAQHCRNVILTASIVSLLFNLNPLMRFDGYFALSDLVGIPNLAGHAQQVLRQFLGRLIGMSSSSANHSIVKWSMLFLYAIAAWCWRLLISISIFIGAESMFFGAGIALCVVTIVYWWWIPMVQYSWRCLRGLATVPRFSVPRVIVLVGLCLGGASLAVHWLPFYSTVRLPCLVDFEVTSEVRPKAGGFLRQVHAEVGDIVETGQLLVQLENVELELEAEKLRLEIEQSEQLARQWRSRKKNAAYQVQQKKSKSLYERLTQIEEQIASLAIVAPCMGQVVSWPEELSEGRFLHAGDLVCKIAGGKPTRLKTLVPQREITAVQRHAAEHASFLIDGSGERVNARIVDFDPKASTSMVYPELSAQHGGHLPVMRNQNLAVDGLSSEAQNIQRSSADAKENAWVLLEPHLQVTFAIDELDGPSFQAGQTGVIRLRAYRGVLGKVITRNVATWWRKRRQLAWDQWRFQS